MKKCSKCKKEKSLTEFSRNNSRKSGYRAECKACKKLIDLAYKERLSEEQIARINRRNWLKRSYNISLEDYENLLQTQDTRCKVCFKNVEEIGKKLVVDHCHRTGKVRGLLCDKCNVALGLLQDNLENIANLYKYLLNSLE